MPELEDEVMGVEEEPSDELDDDLEVELEVALDEDAALAVPVAGDVVPGMVCALTAPSRPTPATALNATPTVILFSRRIAALRA